MSTFQRVLDILQEDTQKSIKDILIDIGFKHKLGTGYKPELDPYQTFIGDVSFDDVDDVLRKNKYKYTNQKGKDAGMFWYVYDRSFQGYDDTITLYSKDAENIIKVKTYSGRQKD